MAFCQNCGARFDDSILVCPACGAPVGAMPNNQQQYAQQQYNWQQYNQNRNNQQSENPFTDVNDFTSQFDPVDIQDNKVVSIFSYLGILVLVPLLAARESPFAQFHAKQGVTLCIFEVAYSVLSGMIKSISGGFIVSSVLGIVSLFFFVLAIIGIINAAQGKAKELPVIGGLKIIK